MSDIQSLATSRINMAARLTNQAARIRLGDIGAWPGQISVLLCLISKDGLSQKEILRRAKMEQSTVAEHLNRLEKNGLITRRRSDEDKRVVQFFLTPKARTISSRLVDELESGARMFTKNISKQDLAIFDKVICQIIDSLEQFIHNSEKRSFD